MPRRKDTTTATEKRGRNACWKCKERRIRCTLEKPVCSNCARWKHTCQYGLKLLWREEALARGICFGRQGVYGQSTKDPISSRPLSSGCFRGDFYFLHTSSHDFAQPRHRPRGNSTLTKARDGGATGLLSAEHDEVQPVDDEEPVVIETEDGPTQIAAHNPGPINQLSVLPSAEDSGDLRLFDFFVSYMCPGLSNSTTENPYWELVVPLSFTSVPLFHALLSWAASEASVANPSSKDAYSVVSVKNKVRALQGLRMEIESAHGDWSSASDHWASILSTIILLSCNDIANLCSPVWITHLKAARVLCSMAWPRQPGVFVPDKFRKFCITWFLAHEIMSRTAWIQDTLFDPGEWFASDDETEIDPMIACSRGLIQQVSAIGTLITDLRGSGGKSSSRTEQDPAFKRRRDSIEDGLKALDQRISTGSQGSDSDEVLLQVAEGKRLCALIYLYACIDNATPTSPTIQGLTRQVIDLLTQLPPKPSLTFILFVVGTLGVWDEEDRRLVLDKFDSLIKARWLAFVVRARDVVMDVWIDRDLGKDGRWEDLVETKSKLLSLA
ncbi:hypothetical protein NM208_g5876 [Fusarium decemcellulare]|uniref:Uncharacterized protein n=1 Tax=Fusarium decemcellulare TaxID=57161 RepID=A0ACC1SFH4_9HYPO|nr:hypothetical protein NM208_g5876 [Fusarium decemcellulare]